jgi:hypothetical protein
MNYVFRHGRRIEVETLDPGGPKRRRADPFVQVPLRWAIEATKAMRTPKALVWVRLLHLRWKYKAQTFCLPNKWLEEQGVSRFVKNRTLNELEANGLIAVERRPHKSPRITLL